MDTSFLFAIFSSILTLSEELKSRIRSILTEQYLPKKHILLREGEINRNIYFIEEGFARAFYIANGREYTSWFMGKGDLMISVYSFFTRKPAHEKIEILEDAKVLYTSWDQLQSVYAEFPEFNIVGRILTEQYYIKSEERAISLRTLSATERYKQLMEQYPLILQKANLGHIASHLGISQERLSRIRAYKS